MKFPQATSNFLKHLRRTLARFGRNRRPANERLTGFLRAGYKSRNTRLMPIPTRLMLSLTLLALLSGCVSSSGTRAKSGSDGWKTLFDGKTFAGWRGYRMKAMPAKGWRIEDGILKKVGGEHGGDIITDETFDNFELNWEWRISKGGNNGIKYLVTEDRPSAPGPEYQMIDDKANEDGKLGPKQATASFYDVLPPSPDEPLKNAGEWNSSRVLIQGNHVEHWLNGKKVLEYELGSETVKAGVARSKFKNSPHFGEKIKGHILLTDHHDECWFRNIRIRELAAR